MFDYSGLQDGFFIALYIGAAIIALTACLYLLLRRVNAVAGNVKSSRRLRRWTAGLMAAVAASHVWWYGVGVWLLADDWLVRTIIVIMLDYVTLVPLVMAVLLCMLQDHRRPLWLWLVMQVPVVVAAVVGIAQRSTFWGFEMTHYWQLFVIAVFITYYIYGIWRYGRWLRNNYADLDRKEVWQSLVFAIGLLIVYVIYTSNAGELMREYLSQVITLFIIAFLVWRVETLQDLGET